jgi:hypothetical protein
MKVLGRLLLATALLVPAGIAAAPSAQASGTGGHFNCQGTGSEKITPGLLLTTSFDQRFQGSGTGITCTGGVVTGGSMTFNLTEENVRCPNLKGRPVHGTLRMIWNTADKAGQTLLKLAFTITATAGKTSNGTIAGTVASGHVAVGRAVTGTFALNKGLNSIPNGGNCAVQKRINFANVTAIAFKA